MSSIEEMQQSIRKFCDDRDWDQFHNLKDLLISLSLEAAEALEHVQWKNEAELRTLINENEALGEELADVLYWTLLIANKANLDLSAAFIDKMKKNKIKYPVKLARGQHDKYTDFASE